MLRLGEPLSVDDDLLLLENLDNIVLGIVNGVLGDLFSIEFSNIDVME